MAPEIPGFYYGMSVFTRFFPSAEVREAVCKGACLLRANHTQAVLYCEPLDYCYIHTRSGQVPRYILTPVSTNTDYHRPGEEEVLQDSSQPCCTS